MIVPASPAAAAPLGAVPREIIVRYDASADAAPRARARGLARVTAARKLLLPDTQLVRVPPGVRRAAALSALNGDPAVRYAEPNWLYRAHAIPNDPRFGDLWHFHNTGQTVQGIPGTPGADISAPEAWDVATGSPSVKVAVMDSGIQYAHADLAANIWHNPGEVVVGEEGNGVDDDGNGLTDDLYGWNFNDASDRAPLDTDGHGTAIAGIIGAVGNNGRGITGINWDVSLVALKVGNAPFSLGAIIDATVYAGQIGADVVNMSFGGTTLGGSGFSAAHRDAMAAAADTLFVPAAGNGSTNLDTSPVYPCSYDLPNVVCVTATDNRDEQVYNYGPATVDLAAPGHYIFRATLDGRVPFSDDFEGVGPRWDYSEAPSPPTAGKWRRTVSPNGPVGTSTHLLEDSELQTDYPNNADARATSSAPIDLSGEQGCFVIFDANIATEPTKDHVRVEAAASASGPFTELTRVSGDTHGFQPVTASLAAFEGGDVYLRLRLTSDGQNAAAGAQVDNVKVRCDDPANGYWPGSGTSFAAPHVAGAAALVKSHMPGLSVAELRERILRTVDPLPSLQGKTVTGGRLNVARALTADLTAPSAAITDGPPGATTSRSASFSFASEPGAWLECSLDGAAFGGCSSPAAYDGLALGAHAFAVRASDAAGNVGQPATRSWTIEDAAPDDGEDEQSPPPPPPPPADPPPDEPGTLVAPDPADPEPEAFGAPRLAVAVPSGQRIRRLLRRGLVVTASVDAACPCRLAHSLRLRARPSARVGRLQIALKASGRVRATVKLSRRARARLAGVQRLGLRLATTLSDRYGRTASTRAAAALRS
jgi:subtilisin family serine protease